MKINQSFLVNSAITLLLTATVSAMDAETKTEIRLTGESIYHPVFGNMKVISHIDEINYYNSNVKSSDNKEELADNFIKYAVKSSSFEKIKKEELKQTLITIAESTAGMNMLKVITSNYMHEYNLLKDIYNKKKHTLYGYKEAINDLKLIQETDQVNKFKEELLEAKIKRHHNIFEDKYDAQSNASIGYCITSKLIDNLVSEFGDSNSSGQNQIKECKKYNNDLYKRINITIKEGEPAKYDDLVNEITLTPIPYLQECYFDKSGNILPNPKTSHELDTLEHELFHAMNHISLEKICDSKLGWQDDFLQELMSSVTEYFKYHYTTKCGRDIKKTLKEIYDNHHEMMAMYGIVHYNDNIYYEPINEAVATTHVHYYANELKPVIRISHRPVHSETEINNINKYTTLYSYYFDNNEMLRDKMTATNTKNDNDQLMKYAEDEQKYKEQNAILQENKKNNTMNRKNKKKYTPINRRMKY